MSTAHWVVSRTAVTFLLDDLGYGVPVPFEPSHPYTTAAERDACRAQTHPEPIDMPQRRMLSVLATAPMALVAMGALGEDVLLARACWDGQHAVLAHQSDADTVTLTEIAPADLLDAVVRLIPDAPAAPGTSVRVPLDSHPEPAEMEDSIYNDFGPSAESRAVTAMFSTGVSRCGAFIPVCDGTEQPPVTWFDTGIDTETVRRFGTTTPDSHGTPWTTYVPGDNSRISQALHTIVEPLRLRSGS